MIEELCCCTIIFVIIIIIFFRTFGRAIVVRQGQQPPSQQYQGPAAHQESQSADINMIQCQYCEMMYDERLSQCPKCGGF